MQARGGTGSERMSCACGDLVGFDERADVSLDLGDLVIEDFDEAADALDMARSGFTATVLLLGSHEDELIARFCESREGVAGRRRDLLGGRPHGAREGGEHPRVDRVGLGELAAGTGKVASTGRIDPGKADVGRTQRARSSRCRRGGLKED